MGTRLRLTCAAVWATRTALPLLFCCLVALSASAQEVPVEIQTQPPEPQAAAGPPPANLAFADGEVDVTHDGVTEGAAAPLMLLDGDLIRTRNGRAEIVFGDGTLLHVDHDTEIELLSPTRLRLPTGRVLVRVSSAATAPYTIDTQPALVRLDPRGEYGVISDGQYFRLEVRVARGIAELEDNGERWVVRDGEMATIRGAGSRPVLEAYNSARSDTFERWSATRTNDFSTADSARRVPSELRPYGPMLDSYGRWDYVEPYGNVWYPAVGAVWRPYSSGSWHQTGYGLTWIGYDPWAWPTHHFGRWGFNGAAWYWIPGNVWGPAWVSWGYAPGFVSWCPLGWNGQPALGFWSRPGFKYYDPWKAWTIMPRDKFGFGAGHRRLHVDPIDPGALPERTRRMMVVQNVPPAGPAARAVSRGTLSMPTAIRGPGNTNGAVRRDVVEGPRPGSVRRPLPTPAADVPSAFEDRSVGADAKPKIRDAGEPRTIDVPAVRTPETALPMTPEAWRHWRSATSEPRNAGTQEPRNAGTSEPRAKEKPAGENPPPRYSAPEQSRSRDAGGSSGKTRDSGGSGSSPRQGGGSVSAPKVGGKTSSGSSGSSGSSSGGAGSVGGGGGKGKPGK